jgi:DNA-3-methyladenine glycosylase II
MTSLSAHETFDLAARGPFSLRAAAEFGFGPNRPARFDGVMRLAFALDGGVGYAGAALRQPVLDGPIAVDLRLRGSDDVGRALTQVARIVSLDHDGEEFIRVGERDAVIARLQQEHHGQRPVLFHSPYEAAAWAIVSARRPAAQAARVREGLAAEHGETFELAGRQLAAFPQPDRLAQLAHDAPGLSVEKVARLRALAAAAAAGDLDVARLHALGPEQAYVEVQKLKGLGPFYAGLVVVRASGFADAFIAIEPRGLDHMARFYELPEPPGPEQLAALAERWRPFRTWCMVLIRLAGERAFGRARA